MDTTKTRLFGPARIVALGLVALTAAGLLYLRFAPDAGPVSVPAGAHAGQLTLKPCTYATELGSYAADCGTLVVPENRHDPKSRLIALPVTRIRARSAHPGAPIFRLQGGPGITNMAFRDASRFAGDHDVVLVGYRGIDGSVRLDCPEVVSALKRSDDLLSQASFDAKARAYGSCASRLQADGVDLGGYSLPERVDDLEAARRALGYQRVDLLSESAGTRTAMIYSWRYPKSIERSVMIGANPPGNFIWHPKTTDAQIGKYSALCTKDASCRKRTSDLAATLRANSADIPDHWWFLPIRKGNVRLASFFGLISATSAAEPLTAPMTLDSWFAAGNGDPSGLWFMSLMAGLAFPQAQVWGDVASVARTDSAAAEHYFAGEQRTRSILGKSPGSDFLWAGGTLRTAWPAGPDDNAYSKAQTSRVPTLLIGGDLDLATPPQRATRELLPHLPNGHQVVLPNLGHTDDFWSYEPEASSHLVNTFLANGKVDDSLYTNTPVDFTPGLKQTVLAKGLLGAMVGFAALAVLSLLWLPRRVHTRGRIGRRSAASIRSLYVLVLGLGGWFAGTLVVLTTMPTVPLDSDLVAGISVGAPVGLGIYWAWVHREWSPRTKGTGLAGALAGALVGAWLGCNATSGILAALTAIIGAVVGANLIVLVLDIARDVSVRRLVAEPARPAVATPELG
jgi:pimeloyl-ACP methyl ester carboxylesterase